MSVAAIHTEPVVRGVPAGVEGRLAAASERTPAREPASFVESLRAARARPPTESLAREAAEQLVATSLVLPVLALLREGADSEGPFAPGDVERRFGPLLDQHIADRMTQSANFPLVDQLVRRLTTPHASAALQKGRSG